MEDFKTLVGLAEQQTNQMNWEGAAGFYERALTMQQQNTECMDGLAECLLNMGDVERAKHLLEHSIKTEPDSSHGKYMYYGQIVGGKEAVEAYKCAYQVITRATERAPNTEEKQELTQAMCSICCNIVETWMTDLCDEPEAEAQCEQWVTEACKVDPNNPEGAMILGSFRLRQSRRQEAEEALVKCCDLFDKLRDADEEEAHPTFATKVELIRNLLNVNRPDKAKHVLYQVQAMCDTEPMLWFLFGKAYHMQKRYSSALKCYWKCARVHDQSEASPLQIEDLLRSQAETKQALGDLAEKIDLNQPVTDSEPEDGSSAGDDDDDDDDSMDAV